jgi:hypothetical protein
LLGPVRWIALLLLLAGIFAGLRGLATLPEPPEPSPIFTERVVVVGVTGRTQLTDTDRAILDANLSRVQVGSVSIRPRYVGDCAAAGWTTLGAGRRAAVGGLCEPQVSGDRVVDWEARTRAAAARRGDARLGTLAGSVSGCVAAVGPGAALAAARPDGTLAAFQTADDYLARGPASGCPITVVDAGPRSDEVIRRLAVDDAVTLIVTGIGPPPGSNDRSLQVFYRLGTTFPGWATSASTRRTGIVTLTDLTRTLVEFGSPGNGPVGAIDGSPLAVDRSNLTVEEIEDQIAAVAALSDTIPLAYRVLGALAGLVVAAGVVGAIRHRPELVKAAAAAGGCLAGAMLLTGSVPWEYSDRPVLVLSLTVVLWWAAFVAAAYGLGRLAGVPPVVTASALIALAFTVDAALGGPLQSGSMLNSRPIYGLRWYGFGNSTFAAYATTGLLVAGYLAHRLLAEGRRRAALSAVASIGLLVIICEGWPSMGSDFGGVIALTPPLLGLLLVLSGLRITPLRMLALGAAAVLAIGLISGLDWARGPDRRSHLGNFVQRILDGDALDVVARKAVASWQTIADPLGVFAIVLGIAVWVVAIRFVVPGARNSFSTLGPITHTVMAVGVLGTLLNDAGTSVWLAVTIVLGCTVAWFAGADSRSPMKPTHT